MYFSEKARFDDERIGVVSLSIILVFFSRGERFRRIALIDQWLAFIRLLWNNHFPPSFRLSILVFLPRSRSRGSALSRSYAWVLIPRSVNFFRNRKWLLTVDARQISATKCIKGIAREFPRCTFYFIFFFFLLVESRHDRRYSFQLCSFIIPHSFTRLSTKIRSFAPF